MSKKKNIDKVIEYVDKYKEAFGMCPRQIDVVNEFGWTNQYVNNLFKEYSGRLSEYTEYRVWYYEGALEE